MFSGLTVAASLAGLLVFPDDFLRSMGAASLAVVLLDLAAALTLLPALLSLLGHRIRPSKQRSRRGLLRPVVAFGTRHRVQVIVGTVAVLALAAVPFWGVAARTRTSARCRGLRRADSWPSSGTASTSRPRSSRSRWCWMGTWPRLPSRRSPSG